MEKSHILWNDNEVEIYEVDGVEVEYLNLEASIRVYEAFKSIFEAKGKVKSPAETGMLFSVSQAIKMKDAKTQMALDYMATLSKKEIESSDEKYTKYKDVLDFYEENYKNSSYSYGLNVLMSFFYNDDFGPYSESEWLEVSKILNERYDNYTHDETLEKSFKKLFLLKRMSVTNNVSADDYITPEAFVGRLGLIQEFLDNNPDKNSSFAELTEEKVLEQFSQISENKDYKELLEKITKYWKPEDVYCYDAIIGYLNDKITESEKADDGKTDDEEETFTILKRIKKAQQTAKQRPEIVYSIVAGTGIISLIICTFVFDHNPISVISNCGKAFKGLFSSNPAFLPLAKRLGDLTAYFGTIYLSWKFSKKAIREFTNEDTQDEDLTVEEPEEDLTVEESEEASTFEEPEEEPEEDLTVEEPEEDLTVDEDELGVVDVDYEPVEPQADDDELHIDESEGLNFDFTEEKGMHR